MVSALSAAVLYVMVITNENYALWGAHCKERIEKFKTIIPRKGIAWPQSQFPHSVSVCDLYIPTIDLPILLQELCGPILGVYKSLTAT